MFRPSHCSCPEQLCGTDHVISNRWWRHRDVATYPVRWGHWQWVSCYETKSLWMCFFLNHSETVYTWTLRNRYGICLFVPFACVPLFFVRICLLLVCVCTCVCVWVCVSVCMSVCGCAYLRARARCIRRIPFKASPLFQYKGHFSQVDWCGDAWSAMFLTMTLIPGGSHRAMCRQSSR